MAGKLPDHRGIADGSRWNRDCLLGQADLDCVDGLLVFFAALIATLPAKAWIQGGSGQRVLSESQNARSMLTMMPIATEALGLSDV